MTTRGLRRYRFSVASEFKEFYLAADVEARDERVAGKLREALASHAYGDENEWCALCDNDEPKVHRATCALVHVEAALAELAP